MLSVATHATARVQVLAMVSVKVVVPEVVAISRLDSTCTEGRVLNARPLNIHP